MISLPDGTRYHLFRI
uniref:Uncharacterized protein n=1 Tax=Lepeophtheirus salmonis TaxID=72036 RepID=A0A0K2T4M5_LEPSM